MSATKELSALEVEKLARSRSTTCRVFSAAVASRPCAIWAHIPNSDSRCALNPSCAASLDERA